MTITIHWRGNDPAVACQPVGGRATFPAEVDLTLDAEVDSDWVRREGHDAARFEALCEAIAAANAALAEAGLAVTIGRPEPGEVWWR